MPFSLVFDVRRIEPFITADTLVVAHLSPERLRLDTSVTYAIERAGVFRLELDVPTGYDVDGCSRPGDGRWREAAEVDTFHLRGAGGRLVRQPLAEGDRNRIGLRRVSSRAASTIPSC